MGSLRARLTLLATAIVFFVLTGAAVLLFVLQRGQLTDRLDASLQERADAIELLLDDDELPVGFTSDDEDRAVQIVTPGGVVVVASANLAGAPPVATLGPDEREVIRTVDEFPADDDRFRLLSRRISAELDDDDGNGTVSLVLHVAESSDDLDDATSSLFTVLEFAIPILTALMAALTWVLVGRALRPVDVMRAEVDAIADPSVLHRVATPDRNDEIGRLGATLNGMLARLHHAGDRQRRFVADAAHELRTPITRLRTTVEVDLEAPGDAEPERTLREVRREAIGLQELIDDLLVLAAGDRAPTARHTPIDLDEIVLAEARAFRRERPTLTLDTSRVSGCDVLGDASQLQRVVRNLLANAGRHAATTVTLSAAHVEGRARLVVDDDGPGVPAEQREAVFDRFARLDDARSADDGGTGLGLAIVADLVARHGGSVRCDEAPLGGARFEISLPVAG